MAKNTIGNLHIEVDIALAKMQAQLDTMGRKVKSATKKSTRDFTDFAGMAKGALASLGVGLSLAGITAGIKSVIDFGSKINDLSLQANTSTDAFQALSIAAQDAGVDQQQLANVLSFLRKSISETAAGTGQAVEAFKALGLNARVLAQLPTERALERVAKAVAGAKDQTTAYGYALDILGAKNAPRLQEVLSRLAKEGFDGLAESTKKLRLTKEQLDSLDAAGDKLERIGTQLKIIGAQVVLGGGSLFDQLFPPGYKGENIEAAANALAFWQKRVDTLPQDSGAYTAAVANMARAEKELADLRERIETRDDPLTSVSAARRFQLESLKANAQREAAILAERVAVWEESTKAFQKAVDEQTKESTEGFDASVKAIDDYAIGLAELIDPTFKLREEMQLLRDAMAAGAVGADMGAQRMAQLNHQLDELNPSMQELRKQAEETQKALDQESDSLLEFSNEAYDAVNPTNELARAMDNVRLATEAGFLDPETGAAYIKTVEKSLEKTEKVTDAARELGNAFESAFEDAIVNGAKFKDVLRGLAQDILRLFVRQQISAPIASWFSSAFSAYFGGGKAVGGPVDPAKGYVVGEEGPEFFIPDSKGTIIPAAETHAMRDGMSSGSGGGGGNYYIDARGADKEGLNRLEAMIYALNGSIEHRALAAVIDGKRRRTPGMSGAFA